MRSSRIISAILFTLMLISLYACGSPQVETSLPSTTTDSLTEVATKILEPTQPPEPADIIFHNGNIITIEKEQPSAEAVAIRGNLIQAVGSDEDILALQGSNTVVLDLKGNTLMPGIINQHTHYLRNGLDDGIPLEDMMHNFLRFGYTSETEMHSIDDFINDMLVAEKNGEIEIRLNIAAEYNCGFLENGKSIECISWYKDHDPILDPAAMVRVPGVKIFMDGAGVPVRGCPYYSIDFPANITDYWPDIWETCGTPHGDLYLTEEELTPVLQDIQERGYQAYFHAMGDGSIDVILNSIETVLNGESNKTHRHKISHNSMLRPDQMERYVQLDILAQFGGMFNVSEAWWYEAVFGKEEAGWAANRFGLPALGIHVSFGNDYNARSDINNLNPFKALYGHVTHKEILEGKVYDPPEWVAKHKTSVERVLEIMTIEGAYAVFMEDYTGSIKPGKYADLIIISDNPLTMNPDELINLQVLMTMVNGEAKYCAEGQESFCQKSPQTGTTAKPSTTATQAESVPTPTSSGTVQTAQVKYNCDARSYSPQVFNSQTFLKINIGWGTSTEEQADDFLDAVQYAIYVNGEQVQSNMTHDEVKQSADGQGFVVQVYFDVGYLQPGEHEIHTVITYAKKISDGFGEDFGPGTPNLQIEGTCTVVIE